MKKQLVDNNKDKSTIQKIQDIYMRNLKIYEGNPSDSLIKQIIKNCYKASRLFKELGNDDFNSEWIKRTTEKFEDKFLKSQFRTNLDYENVQISIHSSLREFEINTELLDNNQIIKYKLDCGHCLKHSINLHHCEKCHKEHGLTWD